MSAYEEKHFTKTRFLFEANDLVPGYRNDQSNDRYPTLWKSSLMKLMVEHLRESGVENDQILEINFESMSIPEMDARGFYEYVKAAHLPR